jgi:Chlorophyll A-B binding protein
MSPSMPPEDQSPSSQNAEPAFGWTSYAEKINGRFAMIGLVSLLVLEVLTHQGFLAWLGLR